MKNLHSKCGISLIAVLMFMLAATTASIVIFRIVNSENFSSGARLKASEAYQASESGIDAVHSWLTNRAADAGALVTEYEKNTPRKPILIDLGSVGGNREQNFKAYLIGIDFQNRPLKLKILVEGEARDGSRVSQTAIFSTDGLYRVNLPADIKTADFNQAFHGGFSTNTQGTFSSAIINGDANLSGIATTGNLLVTGSLTVQDNQNRTIGCHANPDSVGDLYVGGNFATRKFDVCGNAYIGGWLGTQSNPLFMKDLYVAGDIRKGSNIVVMGNVTIGGILHNASFTTYGNQNVSGTNDCVGILGNFVMDNTIYGIGHTPQTGYGNIEGNSIVNPCGDGVTFGAVEGRTMAAITALKPGQGFTETNISGLNVYGSVWGEQNFLGTRSQSDAEGKNGKTAYFGIRQGSAVYLANVSNVANNIWKQSDVHFMSRPNVQNPSNQNKPVGANPLEYMATKVVDCPYTGYDKCVKDPLQLPDDTKAAWMEKGARLDSLVNSANPDTSSLPKSCIRLVRTPKDANGGPGFGASWGFGDKSTANPTRDPYNFVLAANDCYADLLVNDDKNLLYPSGAAAEKFLVVNTVNDIERSPQAYFDGNFIFVFNANMGQTMKLPPTTPSSKVFVYFKEGATATFPLENTCLTLPYPCKRNYFIYSEKDIAGSSGTTKIDGTIFLANGSKVTGQLPDAGIDFNQDMFNSLINAGILEGTGQNTPTPSCPDPPCNTNPIIGKTDIYWIPISSRLLVKLENKEITKERAPQDNAAVNLEPSILVMPRLIRLTTDQLNSTNTLSRYYAYMYLNKATKNDGTDNLPTCTSARGVELQTNGTNEDGLYRCEFTGTRVPHSDFYVKVGGLSGDPKIWLEADRTVVSDENEETRCAKVYVMADPNDENTSREATVSIAPEIPITGWTVTPSTQPVTVTISSGEGMKLAYTLCKTSSEDWLPAQVGITAVSGATLGTPNQVTITRETPNITIQRIPCAIGPELCNDMVVCPTSENTWLNLQCNAGTTTGSMATDWGCDGIPGQSATLSLGSLPAACEAPSSENQSAFANSLNLKLNAAVQPNGNPLVQFEYDLAWKKHVVTVSGGSVNLVTTNTNVPQDERVLTCSVSSCELYHGAEYSVTHAGLVSWSCNPSAACSGNSYLNTTGSETISATSPTAIALEPLVLGLRECALKDNQKIVVGTNLSNDLSEYVNSYAVAGPCGEATLTYTASGNTDNIGNTINITMSLVCGENDLSVTDRDKICDGSILVVAEIEPTITCEYGATDYYVGDIPSVIVSVSNGNAIICQEPTVSGSTFSGANTFTKTEGNRDIAYESTSNYTFTATSEILAVGTGGVTVQTYCNGTPRTAICGDKTVGPERPCEYQPSWCGGNPFANTTPNWSSAAKNNGCYFVSSIDRLQGSIKVNGSDFNNITCGQSNWGADDAIPCATKLAGITEKDGGYYVYQQNGLSNTNMANGVLRNSCIVPTVNPCVWAGKNQTLFSGATTPASPTLDCSTGGAADVQNWAGLPPSTTTITVLGTQTYHPVPTGVTCNGKAIGNEPSIDCGTLTVKAIPSITSCVGESGESVTLPAKPTQPVITLNDQSNVCSNSGSTTPNNSWANVSWTVSKGGTDVSNSAWNSIFDAADSYGSYRVSGKCGDYPTNLTVNCSGSATVAPAALPACQFQQSWCPGVDWATGIKWGVWPGNEHNANKYGNCYFYDGNPQNNPNCNGCTLNQGDGGYYIFFNSNSGNNTWNFTGAKAKPTNCVGPDAPPPQSSSSVASSSSQSSSSSSAGGGGDDCGEATAIDVKSNISVGDCMKTTCNSGGLRLADYSNSNPKVKLSGGCSIESYTVTNSNGTVICSNPGTVYIKVIEGSGSQFQVGCY